MSKALLNYLKEGPASMSDLAWRYGATIASLYKLYTDGFIYQTDANLIALCPQFQRTRIFQEVAAIQVTPECITQPPKHPDLGIAPNHAENTLHVFLNDGRAAPSQCVARVGEWLVVAAVEGGGRVVRAYSDKQFKAMTN